MNSFALIKIFGVVIASFSQILLKKSAMEKHTSTISENLNWKVFVAYGMFFMSTVIGIYSLRGISISFSTILESLSYILIPVLSMLFLNEKINRKQFIGIIIILVGVIVFDL